MMSEVVNERDGSLQKEDQSGNGSETGNDIVVEKIGKDGIPKKCPPGDFYHTCNTMFEEEEKKPGLAIAVIGDSDSYIPKSWNTSGFITELVKTVQGAHDTWIILKGGKGYVNKILEDTFKKSNQKNTGAVITIKLSLQKKKDAVERLNPYLTNFLSTLSEKFTPLISKCGTEHEVLVKMKVPVLVIAVEGDIYTIHQICSAVKKHLPVLLVKGSGKAVDFIIDYLKETQKRERKTILRANAAMLLGIYVSNTQYADLKICIKSIARRGHFVTIYDMEVGSDGYMEDMSVEAIIKGWALKDIKARNTLVPPNGESSRGETVTFEKTDVKASNTQVPQKVESSRGETVTLNITEVKGELDMELYTIKLSPGSLPLYFYIAYQFIQENDGPTKDKDLQLLLLEAVVAKRTEYVTSLLQHDVKLEKDQIVILFRKTLKCMRKCNPKDCRQIHTILDRVDHDSCQVVWTTDGENTYIDSSKLLSSVSVLCRKLLNYPGGIKHFSQNIRNETITEMNDVFHILLAWSVFADRHDLSGIFWTRCKNPLLTAIMTAGILKNMSKIVDTAKDSKLSAELLSVYRTFENRAIVMLNVMYDEDEEGCMSLMNTEDKIWDVTVSPIECAYDNDMKDIIGHPCVQRFMNRVWYNDTATHWSDWLKAMFPGPSSSKKHESSQSSLCVSAWLSPASMFLLHCVILLALLFAYSFFLLEVDKDDTTINEIGLYELFIYVWTIADFIEEIPRSLILTFLQNRKRGQSRKRHQLYIFMTSPWNWLTILSYLVVVTSLIVRLTVKKKDKRIALQIHSFGLFLVYMRFLQSMMVLAYAGPKIIMIGSMLKELLKFSWLLLVFIMCFGVLYHANMYPEHQDMWPGQGYKVEHWRLWKIISVPYWQIYGETSLEELTGGKNSNQSCTTIEEDWENNLTIERCVEPDWIVSIVAAVYMAISNLLLVNIIIALFSYKFALIQDDSDKLWKFWRCSIINDYSTRYPVPLNLILHIHSVIRWCREKFRQGREIHPTASLGKYIANSSLTPTTIEEPQSKQAIKCYYGEMQNLSRQKVFK